MHLKVQGRRPCGYIPLQAMAPMITTSPTVTHAGISHLPLTRRSLVFTVSSKLWMDLFSRSMGIIPTGVGLPEEMPRPAAERV